LLFYERVCKIQDEFLLILKYQVVSSKEQAIFHLVLV